LHFGSYASKISNCSAMQYFKKLVGDRCDEGYLVYAGTDELPYGDFSVIHFSSVADVVTTENSE
ncbi:MAG: hypothetical protein KDH94_07255, partial [Coxiellaceae bacterium]|nr:hypothetical protein [Coxiellaceae bacterium]